MKVVGPSWIKLFTQAHWTHKVDFSVLSGKNQILPLLVPAGKKILPTPSTQSHTRNGYFKLVVAFLYIHSGFFSHCIKLRGSSLLAVTTSLHYLPRIQSAFNSKQQHAAKPVLPDGCHTKLLDSAKWCHKSC